MQSMHHPFCFFQLHLLPQLTALSPSKSQLMSHSMESYTLNGHLFTVTYNFASYLLYCDIIWNEVLRYRR
ncbi:hypothetical protein XELAEV_18015380mg [Xenopus laevis]|uniref:Uncharacterized protein n=1 Tax=Xenopus laevis TaxID=8355 RepID=A0A974DI84_XENLA|nr:hypothetical protein XELAEV_18015380mg [Xenopus laevis]